ncbi:MAG TPA: hypothetical protein DCZ63_15205 [Geobacter sp.]|nr:hypothetical protein [Geobacter sp.]
MALFEDKRKPVDLYKEGSSTANVQGKMNAMVGNVADTVTTPARTAFNRGALVPAKKLMTDVVAPAARAVAAPITQGREGQTRFLARQAINANRTPVGEREAMGALMGPNFERKLGSVGMASSATTPIPAARATAENPHGKVSNIDTATAAGPPDIPVQTTPLAVPQQSTAATALAQNAAEPAEPAVQTKPVFIQDKNGRVVRTQRPVNTLGSPEGAQPYTGAQQLGKSYPTNGTYRTDSGLEIRFDPGTSPEIIADVMRPSGAKSPEVQAARAKQHEQFLAREAAKARPVFTRNTASSQPPKEIKTFGDIINAKRAMAQQKIDNQNRELGLQETRIGNDLALGINRDVTDRDNARLSARTQLGVAGMSAESAAERNAIDRENMVGQNAERGVNIEGKRMELGNAKKLQDLQNKYLAEKDPVKKKAIERDYLTLTGKAQPKFQISAQESVDPVTGMAIKKSFAVNPDDPTESFEIGGAGQVEQAPQAASARVKGKVYTNPQGKRATWDGTGWVPVD